MEEETIGNQAFVLAIKGNQAGFGEACTMDFTLVRNAISQQARGDTYAFAFFVGGSYLAVESFLCFQASVPFRATQRVQTIASTFLCFSSDPSERITRTDSVCWLLSRGSICLYETRSSAWMLTLPV